MIRVVIACVLVLMIIYYFLDWWQGRREKQQLAGARSKVSNLEIEEETAKQELKQKTIRDRIKKLKEDYVK